MRRGRAPHTTALVASAKADVAATYYLFCPWPEAAPIRPAPYGSAYWGTPAALTRAREVVGVAESDLQLTFSATTRERIILHFSREPHARHILWGPVANGYRGLQVAAQVRGADTGVHADQARRDACTRNCSPAGTDIVAMRPPDSGGRISCAF